ncbi:TetR/AcrR family transcriptional regulator [Plantactinospora sp. B24E8]|uniref:TetR/AcrR family transcriptional regulator n=1 Tax=Plantactinospora sp. B24E8 TaxID=3153567 RepID=UPI00325E8207
MPSVTRRRAPDPARHALVEAQILAATERLLAQGTSFTDLGVQRIATEAGVARSTFYTHFRDKSELLMRLANTMRTTAFDVAGEWNPTAGAQGLAEVFGEIVGIYREYAPVLTALNEVASYDPTVREFWAAALNRFVENTVRLLTADQESGTVPADLDAEHAARIIVLGGDRAISEHVAATGPDTSGDPAFARELALIWWHGAYRRPA